MKKNKIKLIAMDLDGTLTQHKSKINKTTIKILEKLRLNYKLVVIGAGSCKRIYNQIQYFNIDVIGHYGMQSCFINRKYKKIFYRHNHSFKSDRDKVIKKIINLRKEIGFESYDGESVEFHSNGTFTFPLLGTNASLKRKLNFDPQRRIRRNVFHLVKKPFGNYNVFIGGTSSFDFVPLSYKKYTALIEYADFLNVKSDEIIYIGDDYGKGGNDEDIFLSDIKFIRIKKYSDFTAKIKYLL